MFYEPQTNYTGYFNSKKIWSLKFNKLCNNSPSFLHLGCIKKIKRNYRGRAQGPAFSFRKDFETDCRE